MKPARKNIAIVGMGLIGGSLALQLHDKKLSSRIVGVDANPQHAQQALELELADTMLELDAAIAASDVIALCIPVDSLTTLLPQLLDNIDHHIVFDMGSTKQALIEAVQNHPKRGRYVATHPMWGTEYSGPAAAMKNAFEGRTVVLCNSHESDADALQWVQGMYGKIGMRITEMNAPDHDLHAAYVSHISHITSFALANTVLEKEKEESAIFELASAGFASTVRLAKSNPAMWLPIFQQNKHNILDVLDEHIAQLQTFREYLNRADEAGLQEWILHANRIKRIIE
jgi:prephenate dehydrogenase